MGFVLTAVLDVPRNPARSEALAIRQKRSACGELYSLRRLQSLATISNVDDRGS
jgi:hypothetical protein